MSDRLGELYGSFLSRSILVLDEERLAQALMRVDAARPAAAEAKARAEAARQATVKPAAEAARCKKVLQEMRAAAEGPTKQASEAAATASDLRAKAREAQAALASAKQRTRKDMWIKALFKHGGCIGCMGFLPICVITYMVTVIVATLCQESLFKDFGVVVIDGKVFSVPSLVAGTIAGLAFLLFWPYILKLIALPFILTKKMKRAVQLIAAAKAAEREAAEAEGEAEKLATAARKPQAMVKEAEKNEERARDEVERFKAIARQRERKAAELAEEAEDAECMAAERAKEIEEADRRRKLCLRGEYH